MASRGRPPPITIVPTMPNEEAMERFPAGYELEKPYLRVTAQPEASPLGS